MRGRKPKPIQRKITEGDPGMVGKRKLQQKLNQLPSTTSGLPACPDHLEGRARVAWEFWADELVKMQLDSRCDAQMLEGACVNYDRAVGADQMIKRQGIVLREPVFVNGQRQKNVVRVKKHPAINVSAEAWSLVRGFCSEFGLSPAARVRLSIVPAANTGASIDDLLASPRLTDAEKAKLQ